MNVCWHGLLFELETLLVNIYILYQGLQSRRNAHKGEVTHLYGGAQLLGMELLRPTMGRSLNTYSITRSRKAQHVELKLESGTCNRVSGHYSCFVGYP